MHTIIQLATTRAKRGPYRQHSDEFKRAAVSRTLVAGASVSRYSARADTGRQHPARRHRAQRGPSPIASGRLGRRGHVDAIASPVAAMIGPPAGTKIWLVASLTDMRAGIRIGGQGGDGAGRRSVQRPRVPVPWPQAQLSMLLEDVDWLRPERTYTPISVL
jgi:hypothetical protein